MEITFNFGGFYESIFSDLIDDMVCDKDKPKGFCNKVDFQKTYKGMSRDIVDVFNQFLYEIIKHKNL